MISKFNEFDIDELCKQYDIENYTINLDGSLDVFNPEGGIIMSKQKLKKIPIKFNKIEGYLDISDNFLYSLEGCPKTITNSIFCENNELRTLKGGPEYVGMIFNCSYNFLTNLVGAPKEAKVFICTHNPLPQEIFDNMEYIDQIIKIQDDYSIWWKDGTLNKFRFDDMMIEIKGEI